MVEFSDDAIADLTIIRLTIAEDSPDRATEKAEEIIALCQLLDAYPGMGRVYAGLQRQFNKRPWVILYRPAETGVYIHRIFDGRQDWGRQDWASSPV